MRISCILLINRKISKVGGQIVLFAAIYIFVFLSLPGYSQSIKTENLFVSSYSVEQGLRQSMVSQVCQDHLGLIWMVTGDGLHYFDGQEFRAFRVPENDLSNQADNLMRSLVESEPGKLLLSSSSSLLSFNTSSGLFQTAYRKEGFYPTIFNTKILGRPLIWIKDEGFYMENKGNIESIEFEFGSSESFPPEFVPVKALKATKEEILVIGETGILKIYVSQQPTNHLFKADWFPVSGVRDIAKTPDGSIIVLVDNALNI